MSNYPDKIDTVEALEEVLSRPSDKLVDFISTLEGDIMILGAGGKVGPTVARRAKRAIDARALQQPLRFLLQRARRLDAAPAGMIGGRARGRFDGGFIVADDRQKIAVAHHADGSACGPRRRRGNRWGRRSRLACYLRRRRQCRTD